MHEIRVTVPPEQVGETARLAHEVGIDRVSVADVYIHGPDLCRQVVSVEASTPISRLFVEALLTSPVLCATDYSLTSRELGAIVDQGDLAELAHRMSEPFPDVIQDLWQLSHVTTSYLARAFAGGVLLATGIIDDNAVAIALFLPFLSQVLAVNLGLRSRDRRLIWRGLAAIAVSTLFAFAGGAVVAAFTGGAIRLQGFKPPEAPTRPHESGTHDDDFFFGIFAPDFRASLKAIATACLRLLTLFPLPDFSLPCLCSFMTLWTLRLPLEPLRGLE